MGSKSMVEGGLKFIEGGVAFWDSKMSFVFLFSPTQPS